MTRRRLFLHVGLVKTGTSYLQSVFWQSPDELRAQGLELVPRTPAGQFWLMLDVRGRYEPGKDPPAAGRAVRRLPRQLEQSTAPRALVTAESLAPATDEQIERLLAASASHEAHVVLTVRDLARQIPSSWQQRLRMGNPEPFEDYLERLRKTEGTDSWVWRQKDVPMVLGRWARHVPPERIHVVTVPGPGGRPADLLDRFCRVLEVDPTTLRTDNTRANDALGHVGAELLRRVNDRIDPALKQRQLFGEVGKRYFALGILAAESGRKIKMPVAWADWCREVSQRQVDYLRGSGFDIAGDLDDLLPHDSAFTTDDHRPTDGELAEAGADALAAVLTDRLEELRERRAEQQQARGAGPAAEPGPPPGVARRVRSAVAARMPPAVRSRARALLARR